MQTTHATQTFHAPQAPKRDWGLIIGGIALAVVGAILLFWPGLTMVTIATVAGVLFLAAGAVDLVNAFRFRADGVSGWAILNAILDLVLGLLFLVHPITGAVVLAGFVGAGIAAYGVFAIVAAVGMRGSGTGWGWMLALGVVSVICGIGFFLSPAAVAYFVAFFLVMRGITMAVYGATAPQALCGGLFC